jgi:membrane protease subunit HflC
MKRNLLTLVIGAMLVVIFALLLFVFQVRQSEVAIVTTFGKPTANPITEPGAYFKWPWPIQNVYKFDKRVQNFEDKFNETPTADSVMIIVTIYTGWEISDAREFYPKFLGSVPAAQRTLESIMRNAKNAVVASHNLSDFVNSDPQQLKFDQIQDEIKSHVQAELSTNDYGIKLDFLGFKKIELPESVSATVFTRMTAERQQIINSLQYDGERQASEIKSAADRQAVGVINNATADAIRIKGEGEAASISALKIYEQNPELAIYLQSLDTLQKSLNQKTTLIFDERTPPFNLFSHLPTNSPSSNP